MKPKKKIDPASHRVFCPQFIPVDEVFIFNEAVDRFPPRCELVPVAVYLSV